jgi:death on curing protein
LYLEKLLLLHKLSIQDYGGSHGVRDFEMLDSASQRPFQTFDNKDLYPNAISKAAAIGESIIINHPFVDGNKRTGMLAIFEMLVLDNLTIQATEDQLYQFVIDISTGTIRFDEIVAWLKEHTVTCAPWRKL